jgi:hypothetical protein
MGQTPSSRVFDYASTYSHSSNVIGLGGAATNPNFCAKVSFLLYAFFIYWLANISCR